MYTFKENKYTVVYYNIINKAKEEGRTGYTENHHIIPRSLGGNNSKTNLVKLSAREHFIVHLLLIKMVNDEDIYRMVHAIIRFKNKQDLNSKDYELLRTFVSKYSKGKYNHSYGRTWCHITETKEILYLHEVEFHKRSDLTKGLPYQRGGFSKGRISVNKNEKTALIFPHEIDEYLDNGWKLGRHINATLSHMQKMAASRHTAEKDKEHSEKMTGRIVMHMPLMDIEVRIKKIDKKYYIIDGWQDGVLEKNKNRIWMNNDGVTKMVSPTNIQYYTDIGWTKGRITK